MKGCLGMAVPLVCHCGDGVKGGVLWIGSAAELGIGLWRDGYGGVDSS